MYFCEQSQASRELSVQCAKPTSTMDDTVKPMLHGIPWVKTFIS